VLVGREQRIVGLVDWEFAYVGLVQFALDPPWWLLFEEPECWPFEIESWCKNYEKRLEIWLQSMRNAENPPAPKERHPQPNDLVKRIETFYLNKVISRRDYQPIKLSKYMNESWEAGRFWVNYAAPRS
jgi:hypothetical protein